MSKYVKTERVVGIVIMVAALAAIGVLLINCKTPTTAGPGDAPKTGTAISCATQAVRENWARAYPAVMNCLTAILDSPMGCLDAIPTAVAVGMDVVACIVRGAHKDASRATLYNPGDLVSDRKARRSAAWLASKGFQFAEP